MNFIRNTINILSFLIFFVFLLICAYFIFREYSNNNLTSISVSSEFNQPVRVIAYTNTNLLNPKEFELEQDSLLTTSARNSIYFITDVTALFADSNFAFTKNGLIIEPKAGSAIVSAIEIFTIRFDETDIDVLITEPSSLIVDANRKKIYVLSGQVNTSDGRIITSGRYLEWQIDQFATKEFNTTNIKQTQSYRNLFDFAERVEL